MENSIKLVYIKSYKKHCYLIISDYLMNYKKKILIINTKLNI